MAPRLSTAAEAERLADRELESAGATEAIAFGSRSYRSGAAHAELLINDSRIILADEFPDMGYRSPQSHGGSSMSWQAS